MALGRSWEKFNGGPANKSSEAVRVTINKRGMIYMNRRAFEAFGRPKAVALYYSREEDSIALESAYERFKENFPVVKKQMGLRGARLDVLPALQHPRAEDPAVHPPEPHG